MSEYKIAKRLGCGIGGMKKEIVQGDLLNDGKFGLRRDESGWSLTHIPTGRWVGTFGSCAKARKCAKELAGIGLPWDACTLKEWNSAKGDVLLKKAREIIEQYGGRNKEA